MFTLNVGITLNIHFAKGYCDVAILYLHTQIGGKLYYVYIYVLFYNHIDSMFV